MIGTQVGSWVLQKLLGAGGMGRVYLAEHVMMKDLWAVKVLAEELTQREDIVRRFVNEARAAAKVRHRNLVRVVHVDQVPRGPWYMVLEYLEGTTLGGFMASQNGPIPYAFIVRTLCQVASALHTIHNHGIVHRDIKADNIFLVAREGDAQLPIVLDLGVAFLGELSEGVATGRGTVIGTPCYMAPEQLLGQPVGPTADVYALGVLVYQMSTGGWFPYQHDAETFDAYVQLAPAELYRRQSAEALIDPRRRNPGISDAWARMIYALLAVDVSRRTHDARTAGLELARALPSDGAMIDGLGIVRQYAKELLQTDDLRVTLQSQMPKVIVTPGSEARYALGAKIGAGGMAEVFAGTQIGEQGFERPVAIKRILSELSSQPGFAAMFIAEARIVSRLTHPNVVSVIDFRKDEQERWFLVMEYVEGKDLRALLDAGPLPPSTIIFVTVEMLRGLGYAHGRVDSVTGARGLVHRDISPENVLLSYAGDVKVNDFGLARMKDVRGRAGTTRIAGKPSYMSPEQVRGDPLDQRSDLWAVGVMLWEMLACQPMLTGTALEVMGQVQFKTIPAPSTIRAGVPADLEAIAMRLLQRDPDLRYASASLVIDDLVRCSGAPLNGRDDLAAQLAARFRPTSPHVPRSAGSVPPGELTRSQPPVGVPTTLGSAASHAVAVPSTRDSGKRRLFVGTVVSFLVVVAAIAGITALQRRAAIPSGATPAHAQPATPIPAGTAPLGDQPILPPPVDARVVLPPPVDARTPNDAAAPDATRPVDARQLDAAIEDASIPLAASIIGRRRRMWSLLPARCLPTGDPIANAAATIPTTQTRQAEKSSMQAGARALVIALAGVSALLGGPSGILTAHAGPFTKPAVADARSHLELGNKLYNVRSFDEAIVEYKAGALIEPAPVFDYNLGQCYRFLGKYEESIWHYERFLTRGKPEGKALDAVHDFITQMRSELDKKAMTQKPTDAAPAASQPDRPLQARPLPEPAVAVHTEAWYSDGFGWGLTGAGVVGLAVGGGFLASASSLRTDANATKIQEDYNRLRDKASTRELLGAVIGIGGAGLLVTGIIKLAIHSEEPRRVAGWNVAASGDGVAVFGQF